MGSLALDAGGPAIQRQCRRYIQQYGKLADGDVYVSTAGQLQCKHVIHAVCALVWPFTRGVYLTDETDKPAGYDAFINSLMAADQLGLSSIVLPALLFRPFEIPTGTSAVKYFLKGHPLTSVRTVYLVDPRDYVVDMFQTSLGVEFGSWMVTTHFGRDDTSQKEG